MPVQKLHMWVHKKWTRAKYRYRLRGILLRLGALSAIIAFLSLTFAAGGVGPAADFVVSGENSEKFNPETVEQKFIDHLNEERKSRGLQTVEQRDELSKMANNHTEDMAAKGYFSHTNQEGQGIEDRYRTRGLLPECRMEISDEQHYPGAENIAKVGDINKRLPHRGDNIRLRTESDVARYLFEGWMDSPGHRDAMLVHSASEAGLGIAISEDGTFYAALELC